VSIVKGILSVLSHKDNIHESLAANWWLVVLAIEVFLLSENSTIKQSRFSEGKTGVCSGNPAIKCSG
jgi:hypothetical protein